MFQWLLFTIFEKLQFTRQDAKMPNFLFSGVQDCNEKGLDYQAFTCFNGYCLRFEKSCNGIIDCADGSDENPNVCGKK